VYLAWVVNLKSTGINQIVHGRGANVERGWKRNEENILPERMNTNILF